MEIRVAEFTTRDMGDAPMLPELPDQIPPDQKIASLTAGVGFKGEKRSNATHASTTDPDAHLYRKSPGTGAMLCFIGHALMENRSGLMTMPNAAPRWIWFIGIPPGRPDD